MEAFLILLVLFILIAPVVALVKASNARSAAESLDAKIKYLDRQLAKLRGETGAVYQLKAELEVLKKQLAELGVEPIEPPPPPIPEIAPSESREPKEEEAPEPVAAKSEEQPEEERAPEPVAAKSEEEAVSEAKLTEPKAPKEKMVSIRTKTAEESEPARVEKEPVAAVASKEAGSFEMKLGTYWFVRIGVVLLLTGVGILAYYNKEFFLNLSKGAKVAGFYLLSAVMGGAGFWLQRSREKLRNYGQVLLAGGIAGVYFTTYAAHIFEPVRVIPNASVALTLLFAWGAIMVLVADRLKSETLALFAIGASYYATYVPLIHATLVPHWVILASNLILAVAAVAFMLRHRWLKMPVLSISASYVGFLVWRFRVFDEPSLLLVAMFAVALWIVYTAAVFLSRSDSFDDQKRAAFLTGNNAAMFGLLTWEVLRHHQSEYWLLPMIVGPVLLACAGLAWVVIGDRPIVRKSYLSQGLVLVTLGIVTTELSESVKGPILAAQSVVLLMLRFRGAKKIFEIGAFIVAALAAVYGFRDIQIGSDQFLLSCLATGVFLLFNAWVCHARVEQDEKMIVRPRVAYFTVVAMALGLVAFLVDGMAEGSAVRTWVPAILVAAGAVLTASVYFVGVREFVLFAQIPAAIGVFVSINDASQAAAYGWPLGIALALALGLAHWWRRERGQLLSRCPADDEIKHVPVLLEVIFSAGVIFHLLAWLHLGLELWEEWLWVGSLLASGLIIYGAITRAPFLAAFGQIFLAFACAVQISICLDGRGGDALRALIPMATMWLTNVVVPIIGARFGRESDSVRLGFGRIQTAYRIGAAALGLLWIYRFVPEEYRVLVTMVVAVLFLLANGWRPAKEWYWIAAAHAIVSGLYVIGEFEGSVASWQSFVAILVLLGAQQLSRRYDKTLGVPRPAHRTVIVAGGVALFLWLSIGVSDLIPGDLAGLRSITWGVLAVAYFLLGLGLKERTYRRMGLVTLGVALLSLVPIIWQMSTQLKIASFFVLGLVFVGLGFIYNHYKEQIRKLL